MLTLCQPVDRHYFVLRVFQLSLSFKYSPVSGLRKKKPCQLKITNSWGQLIHYTREFTEVEDKPDLKLYSLILSIFVLSERAQITHIGKENHTYLKTIEVMQLFFTGSVYIPKRSLFFCSASKIMVFLSGLIPRVSGFPRNWALVELHNVTGQCLVYFRPYAKISGITIEKYLIIVSSASLSE